MIACVQDILCQQPRAATATVASAAAAMLFSAAFAAQEFWSQAFIKVQCINIASLLLGWALANHTYPCRVNPNGVNTLATAHIRHAWLDIQAPQLCSANITYTSRLGQHTGVVHLAVVDGACGGETWVSRQIQICYNWLNQDLAALCNSAVCPWCAGPGCLHYMWYLEHLQEALWGVSTLSSLLAAFCAFNYLSVQY